MKATLSASAHLMARHRGTGRGERIFYPTLSLCRNLREAESAVTHLVVSSTAYDYDSSARLAKVPMKQTTVFRVL